MHALNLKPTHNVVTSYYSEIQQLNLLEKLDEGAVSPAFAALLRHCARQYKWTLVEQYSMQRGTKTIRVDGALVDTFNLVYGYWEAKDIKDDLAKEVTHKFEVGYPQDNILFQAPNRAILWQDGNQVLDQDLSRPEALVDVLKAFFEYQPPAYEEWQRAVEEFKLKVPELAAGLLKIIEGERQTNNTFVQAFDKFADTCREAINPNLSVQAIEEMLIQHLLTERIFSKVFDNPYFLEHNAVARDIKKVVLALTSQHFSPADFLKQLNRFYVSIESTAALIDDFAQKQAFLNTVYEKFFQGYAVKVADTHGIVYTPQPIVRFMVNSIEEILQTEFGRSLSDKDVHILDPFVGTGNFIIHVMRKIRKTALRHKYEQELHCNEVMLLPYYIASMNIEHEYYELTGEYKPFEGICFVDTFELAEDKQLPLFTEENTARVERQKQTPIFVILGNPPYNAGQVNENDNNKNRKYKTMDKRVRETYAKDSTATNKNALSDVYIKAIRWAADRIQKNGEGIVAFVTNNGFIDGIAFDGMRKHLAQDFSKIYHVNLKGNARMAGERRRQEAGNVFDDAIRVGVGISFFIKKKDLDSQTEIYFFAIDDYLKSKEKKDFLEKAEHYGNVLMKKVSPDKNYIWLTEGMNEDFEIFLPMGTKETKAGIEANAIFKVFSRGAETTRDAWVYNFNADILQYNVKKFIETYNHEVYRWHSRTDKQMKLDDFVLNDDKKIKWSSRLKECLLRGQKAEFFTEKIRNSIYRPFCFELLFFDEILTHRRGQFHYIFPTVETELETRVICCTGVGAEKSFTCIISDKIVNLSFLGGGTALQCFPFYTYDENGSNRRENITDWALEQFRTHYNNPNITKWDIFHYVYAILHHPKYREKYAANLKRELPRIPFVKSPIGGGEGEVFRAFADVGRKLAELHVNYEEQDEYPLHMIENPDIPLNWRVEKMKLSKDKTQIIYNDFLTLGGIPPEVFEYRLGNRSALDWIIDQYRIKTDKRSGITNDPNRADDPEYIVRLIKQVVTVSVETVKIVKGLPKLDIT
jgi:predicted helicase